MPTLQEVIASFLEDTTHEFIHQVAILGLSQGRRPSSHRPEGCSMVPHGHITPVQQAVVLLGTRIFLDGKSLATSNAVRIETAAPITATVTGVGASLETPHPDDSPTEAGSPPVPLRGLLLTDLLSCVDQCPVWSCLLSFQQAWQEIMSDQWILDVISNDCTPEFSGSWPPVKRMAPPGVSIV